MLLLLALLLFVLLLLLRRHTLESLPFKTFLFTFGLEALLLLFLLYRLRALLLALLATLLAFGSDCRGELETSTEVDQLDYHLEKPFVLFVFLLIVLTTRKLNDRFEKEGEVVVGLSVSNVQLVQHSRAAIL